MRPKAVPPNEDPSLATAIPHDLAPTAPQTVRRIVPLAQCPYGAMQYRTMIDARVLSWSERSWCAQVRADMGGVRTDLPCILTYRDLMHGPSAVDAGRAIPHVRRSKGPMVNTAPMVCQRAVLKVAM